MFFVVWFCYVLVWFGLFLRVINENIDLLPLYGIHSKKKGLAFANVREKRGIYKP